MLYERWRQVVAASGDETALVDMTAARRWNFRELGATADFGGEDAEKVCFPQGAGAEFVIAVLRAWRGHRVVCPIESGQFVPQISGELPENTIHLKTTSASTGEPRLVAFTAAQLAADAANIVATMGLRPDWPNIGVISLAHSYGFSNLVLPLLLHGIPLVLGGSALPEAVKCAASSCLHATLAGVPALWRAWDSANAIPPNVRLAISAGAPLPVSLEQAIFSMRGLKVHNFYGSSECGGIAYDASSGPRLDDTCVGAPMQNVQVSVAEDGCLQVRSAAVGLTYWPEPDPRLSGGVFHTRDLAEISYGAVYLRGRASDQINIAGRKVSPEAIERVLAMEPSVRECLVFGAPSPDGHRGEIIVACVVPRSGATPETLTAFLSSKLPSWQIPREWWFVDSLQTNERGKLSRAQWRARYASRAQ